MKQECAVVQDLMVLYEDDVLRDESRKIVQEHIRTCEECRKIYERASAPVSGIQDALPDIRESLGRSEKKSLFPLMICAGHPASSAI